MTFTCKKLLLSLSMVTALAACGGGDEDLLSASGGGGGTSTCETKQFASTAGITVPTTAQYTTVAKTYTVGTNSVVLSSTGALSVNGKTIAVKSACFVKETSGDLVMLSWGTANTVGAGNIVYDSHIDFRSTGISGIADGVILTP